jgi:hypothetical protein
LPPFGRLPETVCNAPIRCASAPADDALQLLFLLYAYDLFSENCHVSVAG